MRLTSAVLLLYSAMFAYGQDPVIKIAGETNYEPHKLVRLKAEGAPVRSLITWAVAPKTSVEYPSQLADDVLEFNAEPGEYTVTVTVDWRTTGGMKSQTLSTKVTLKGCADTKPTPKPEPPKPDPIAAIARINFDGAGCTAAAIWPRRPDGKWDLFTAAHCLNRVGQKGRVALKDGRVLPVTVTVIDRGSDTAWLATDESIPDMPFLHLARKAPAAGTKVWHAGFGWEKPGNREEGEIVSPLMTDGKTSFNISLSQGDSGGPILRADNNEVIASACCTTRIAAKALAFGGSCEVAWRLRPVVPQAVQDDPNKWVPAHMPLVTVEKDGVVIVSDAFEWKPAELPVVTVNERGEAVVAPHGK